MQPDQRRQLRDATRDDGEPLIAATRTARKDNGTTTTPVVNLTEHHGIAGIKPGDDVRVALFEDRVVLRPVDNA